MNYFMAILPKMAGFLLLVLIGFAAVKTKVIKKEAMSSISGFLIRFVLPALTISLIYENQTTFASLVQYGRLAGTQAVMYLVMAGAGILGSKICRLKGTTANVYRGCSVGGNYGFLVLPLILTLFAKEGGSLYIPICSVVDTTLVWTVGFALFTSGIVQKENPLKKIFLNPIFLSVILALCLTSFHIPLPASVQDIIDSVGSTSSSWGLIYLGCSLAFMNPRNLLKYKSLFVLAAVKLFFLPLGVYAVSHLFLPQIESLILMLICAAPSMTTSSMIAGQYHLDEEYASAAVVLTTMLCMVVIPILFLIISL